MKRPRLVLTTGGTGGHIFPALAVAEALRRQCPEVDLVFMGSEHGPEGRLARQAGMTFVGLPVRGVLGHGVKAVAALWNMGRAVFMARARLAELQPQVVAGFGAYASAPALLAAKTLGIPVVLHEQNAVLGMVNRLLAPFAHKVYISLPDTRHASPDRAILTGNPIRERIAEVYREPDGAVERPRGGRLLIMGGSQGAKALNSVILGGLPRLAEAGIVLRHQTGSGDMERVLAGYRAHGLEENAVSAFIDDMPGAYAWADMALCRSGASTVAELAAAGKPSLLIPFPFATHDHQTANARVLENAGAAVMVPENELSRVDVVGTLIRLLNNRAELARMALAARSCARMDAADRVAAGLLEILGLSSHHNCTGKDRA